MRWSGPNSDSNRGLADAAGGSRLEARRRNNAARRTVLAGRYVRSGTAPGRRRACRRRVALPSAARRHARPKLSASCGRARRGCAQRTTATAPPAAARVAPIQAFGTTSSWQFSHDCFLLASIADSSRVTSCRTRSCQCLGGDHRYAWIRARQRTRLAGEEGERAPRFRSARRR